MLDLLNGFVGELRNAGIPVSLTENLDAFEAVKHIPIEDREAFKFALAATMIKNASHWKAFETVFEVFFSLRGPQYSLKDDENADDFWREMQDQMRQGEGNGGAGGMDSLTPEEMMARQLDTNFRIMEQIRARVDAIVKDRKTAEALKPYYAYGCKRPTFHDEYLPTFNRPNVTLVDVAPLGVQLINERGPVHNGVQYDLDVLIYATGFDFMSRENVGRVTGSDGRSIKPPRPLQEVGSEAAVSRE